VSLSLENRLDATTGTENDLFLESGTQGGRVAKPGYLHKILVVDDEEDIIFTVKTILTEAGFYVDTFTNPSLAFKMFRHLHKSFPCIQNV
jgi:PleD family two-component response regulator